VRPGDTVGRLSGDEFGIILGDLRNAGDAGLVAQKIVNVFAKPFQLGEHPRQVTGSIGISLYPGDGGDNETLLKAADAAMYRAKAQGRNSVFFFTAEINAALTERLALEKGLRQALERNEFRLSYQPRMGVASGKLTGAEALVRWEHPEHGLLSPARFIPVAEETGLIVPLGEWILREACMQAQKWRSRGLHLSQVSVNMSARQFSSPALVEKVAQVLRETGLSPHCLDLEITESLMMENVEEFTVRLHALKRLGVQLSVDDFGTGYSSLNYLRQFPVDRLKIDRSFVRDIAQDASDAAIVLAVIQLGHVLGLSVTAEGVESSEQLAFLHRHGCDEVQGYYFSQPVSAEEFEGMLERGRTPQAA
jgi:EAL domain-containing protein (putative c-di-GMP-specific phosphodiesterase class I)